MSNDETAPAEPSDLWPDQEPQVTSVSEFRAAKSQLARLLKIQRRQQRPWFGRAVDGSTVAYIQNTPTGGTRRRHWPITGADGFYITKQGELAEWWMNALIVVDYRSFDNDKLNKVYAAMIGMIAHLSRGPEESK